MCDYKKFVKNVEVEIDDSTNSRYLLEVDLDNNNEEAVAVIMKNPSKANKDKSDKTINNVLEVAYRERFGKVFILNLYSYYSPDVNQIKDLIDANKKEHLDKNDEWINKVMTRVDKVIIGWGTIQGSNSIKKQYDNRVKKVYDMVKEKNLIVIDEDFSESRYPKHPQTLALHSSKITLKPWNPTNL